MRLSCNRGNAAFNDVDSEFGRGRRWQYQSYPITIKYRSLAPLLLTELSKPIPTKILEDNSIKPRRIRGKIRPVTRQRLHVGCEILCVRE